MSGPTPLRNMQTLSKAPAQFRKVDPGAYQKPHRNWGRPAEAVKHPHTCGIRGSDKTSVGGKTE